MWLLHDWSTVIIESNTEHSPSLSAFCVWWNHTRGSSRSCPASASAGWRPAARSQMPRDDQSCSRCLLPESAPLEIKPTKHTRATFKFLLPNVKMKFFQLFFSPDLVKRIHRQQHNPRHVQSLNNLIGDCGFPWGAAATQPYTSTFLESLVSVFFNVFLMLSDTVNVRRLLQ